MAKSLSATVQASTNLSPSVVVTPRHVRVEFLTFALEQITSPRISFEVAQTLMDQYETLIDVLAADEQDLVALGRGCPDLPDVVRKLRSFGQHQVTWLQSKIREDENSQIPS